VASKPLVQQKKRKKAVVVNRLEINEIYKGDSNEHE
jgi:hypothetical protein